jgi:hypothetical protein
MTTPNEKPLYPFAIHDFPHELMPNTDMLDGELLFPDPSEDVFPDDIETAGEVH